MADPRTYTLHEETICYQGFFTLKRYQVQHALFAGGLSPVLTRELLDRGLAVGVLPYDPMRDEVVLIEQFRIGALHDPRHPWVTEVVAGIDDKDEASEVVARRETREEIGRELQALLPICRYYVSPGGTSEEIELFCGRVDAAGVEGVYGLASESEDIRAFALGFDEAMTWLAQGRINSAMAIIALQWLALHRDWVREQWG